MEYTEVEINGEKVNVITKLDDDYKDDYVLIEDLEKTQEIDVVGDIDE